MHAPVDELAKVVDDGNDVDVALEEAQDLVDEARVPAQHVQVHRDDLLAPGPLHLFCFVRVEAGGGNKGTLRVGH
jgi:hypothetical protein